MAAWKEQPMEVEGGEQRKREAEEQRRGGEDDQKTTEEGGFLIKAMRGFEKLRERVKGKSLFRNRETGEIRVVKDRGGISRVG
jgi:hypothetical protein